MQEITIDQVREKARSWQAKGEKWHFHVLFPDCIFNTQSNQYALVLENRTRDQTFAVYSDNGFAKLSQELLKLLYGDNILDKTRLVPRAISETPSRPILKRCEALIRDNIPWHHHMLFPDCIYNQHRGKWNLVLESGGESQIINELYDEEPREDFQQMEIAYFEEIDPTF